MTLEQFCDLAGCVVSINPEPEGWYGKYRYHHRRTPNCFFCGFRTEKSARKAFLADTFGDDAAKAVMKLLTKETGK